MQQEYPNNRTLPGTESKDSVILDITEQGDSVYIQSALNEASLEMATLNETIESVNNLKPECDRLDYALDASSGALCGIIDVFLVGKPGKSQISGLKKGLVILQKSVAGKGLKAMALL